MKIKLAIIGIGHLGAIHLKICHALNEKFEIVGICDINETRTQRLANHYNIPFFQDYKMLVNHVDAVTICVPTLQHIEVGKFFLQHNIHTFIEKPISSTIAEAQELINLAEKHQVKLQVGHVERFNSGFQSILRITKDPLFIECHRLNNFPNRSLDIGVVMDLMIHDIDIILGLNIGHIKDIHAIGVNVLTSLEDIANARIVFDNGCTCNLTASRVSEEITRKIRIFQKDTYISLDYVKQEAFVYRKNNDQILKHALPIDKDQPLKKELEHFADCIRLDQTPIVSGKEGLEALTVSLKISDMIWEKKAEGS